MCIVAHLLLTMQRPGVRTPSNGQAATVEQARQELMVAKEILELVANRADTLGKPHVATHLRSGKSEAYPRLGDFKFPAGVMDSTIAAPIVARGVSRIVKNLEVNLMGKQLIAFTVSGVDIFVDVTFVYDPDDSTPLRQTLSPPRHNTFLF